MEALAIPFLPFVGTLLALQAGANVQLSAAMGSPIGASALQLGLAALLLLALAAVAAVSARPGRSTTSPGGTWPAGSARPSTSPPASCSSRDSARSSRSGSSSPARSSCRSRWTASAGSGSPRSRSTGQGAVNAQLRADLDAPVTAGAWSFVVAAAVMLAVLAVAAARDAPPPRVDRLGRVPWWGWLGGLCGVTYVTSVFLLIPEIGVAPTMTLTVAGQQLASLLVDRYGLLRLPRRPIPRARLTGVALLLAGVALIQVA
jgi:bacterial/archaeal transporter family-2 protein